jgi:site-specific DNA-cytosine methylase
VITPSYYEFFAGGGMARAGPGDDWSCLFANDIDAKKGVSYAANWGDEHLTIDDVGNWRQWLKWWLPCADRSAITLRISKRS